MIFSSGPPAGVVGGGWIFFFVPEATTRTGTGGYRVRTGTSTGTYASYSTSTGTWYPPV